MWTYGEILAASKELKINKSRDPLGMISDIFKPNCTCYGLKIALLKFFNLVLETFHIPEELLMADITSIWKRKGSRMNLKNDRGIFVLTILRKIMDKTLYNHFYDCLDAGMSDSNVGARQNRNVRNHLFIVYRIVTNIVNEGQSGVDVMIYDLVQAFDSLWLQDCMNDIFDILPEKKRDRKLALIYETNLNNLVAVNTPVGQTERVNMPRIVQQGGGWGPIECQVSIDKLGRECKKRDIKIFKYKDKVPIIPLAMVDDLLAVATCGIDLAALNSFMNTHVEMKKLRFHVPDDTGKTKCHKTHIGKAKNTCPNLYVHGTEMVCVQVDTYLGDIISSDGSNKPNIDSRVVKGKEK